MGASEVDPNEPEPGIRGAEPSSSRSAPSPRRRPLSAPKKALFGLVAVTGLLGVVEGFFQVREVTRERRKPRLPTQLDPYRGIALIPGARYDFKTRASINAEGLRGPEVSRTKAPGVVRVACVGGSTTFGLYDSTDAATWPAQLQGMLEAKGRRVEVLNGGVPGWTLRANLTDLELRLFAFDLDVVVCYQGYNDLMSNLEVQYREDSKVDDPALLYRPGPAGDLLEKSALYRFMRSRFVEDRIAAAEKVDRVDPDGLAAYERNLRRLARRCQEQGIRLVLCTQPHCYRPTHERSVRDGVPDLDEWVRLFPLTYARLVEGMAAYNEATRRVAAEAGVPVVDLEARVPSDVALYATPIHHTDAGEVEVAQAVADVLLERRVLEQR